MPNWEKSTYSLSPESRQKLLSTQFAQKCLRYRAKRQEEWAKNFLLTRANLRRLRKAVAVKPPYILRMSDEAFEESLVRTQLAMLARHSENKEDK